MFQVTMRTLRNVGCRGDACGGDVDDELFPLSVERWAESELCGRRACSRVNRAVQSVTTSAKRLVVYVALKGAPGRDGPASGNDGGFEVATRAMEKCGVSVCSLQRATSE